MEPHLDHDRIHRPAPAKVALTEVIDDADVPPVSEEELAFIVDYLGKQLLRLVAP